MKKHPVLKRVGAIIVVLVLSGLAVMAWYAIARDHCRLRRAKPSHWMPIRVARRVFRMTSM